MSRRRNKKYSAELKLEAVQAYQKGEGSLGTICKKIWNKIRSATQELDKVV